MFVAALGDVHGEWRQAVTLVEWACAEVGIAPSDLAAMFQVGDAEALRGEDEVAQVPGPSRYRKLGDFPRSSTARSPSRRRCSSSRGTTSRSLPSTRTAAWPPVAAGGDPR